MKMQNIKVHELGSDKNPATRQDVVDKLDEINKQAKELKIVISLIGGVCSFEEVSKLVVLNDLNECIVVNTTFRSGDKESLKTQLHKIVDDLVDAI